MEASRRYGLYDMISHIILTCYSVLLVATAVFSKHLKEFVFFDEIQIVLAVCVLAAGLVIWGLRFGQTSREHEECYHEMESILSSEQSNKEKLIEYDAVKKRFPNHKTHDYETVLFQKIVIEGKKLTDSYGDDISFGYKHIAKYIIFFFIRHCIIPFIFLLPALIILFVIFRCVIFKD